VDSIVRERRRRTFLVKGQRFNIENLKSERERIETLLKNEGYFYFNREFVNYMLDTIAETKTVNIKINILQPSDTSIHQKFQMNEVYVFTDYSADIYSDSLRKDTLTVNEFHFISNKLKFRKGVLMDAIYLKRNDFYSRRDE